LLAPQVLSADTPAGFVAVASLSLPRKASAVCQELPAILGALDDELRAANPGVEFSSTTAKLEGMPCVGGVCQCAGLRRLLGTACTLEVRTVLTAEAFVTPAAYDIAVQSVGMCVTTDGLGCLEY
jgi:hypothetical protein